MSELSETLKTYKDALAVSKTNLDDVPYNVRGGREAQKRQAQASLPALKQEYQDGLVKAAFGIALKGPGVEDFLRIAKEEADVLVIDGAAMYRRIADRIEPSLGTDRVFGVSQFSALIQELRNIGSELNIDAMAAPRWEQPATVNGDQGLLSHVRAVVESALDTTLLAAYVRSQIAEAGIAAEADKTTVPVLITGVPESSAVPLLKNVFQEGRSLLVSTPTDTNKEFVLETFTKVKKQLKKKN